MVEHPQKQAHHVLVLPLLPIECDSWFLEREDPLLGMCGKEQGQMPEFALHLSASIEHNLI